MSDNVGSGSVSDFAARVRQALADLPAAQRDILLEDLEDHLEEVAAEGEGPLAEKLGSPEQYAADLRSAYSATPSPRRNRVGIARSIGRAVDWLRRTRVYREVRAFLPELRPAWWVLRAYLLVLIVTAAFSPGYSLSPIPNLGTKHGLAELVAVFGAVWLSVRLGRRQGKLPKPARYAAIAGNGLVAVIALALLGSMQTFSWESVAATSGQSESGSGGSRFNSGWVTNIYPYSQDGKPLSNVLLYDQDGNPIDLSNNGSPATQYPTKADGTPIVNAYPLVQHNSNGDLLAGPRVAIPAWPPPSPTASATTSAVATPTPSHS